MGKIGQLDGDDTDPRVFAPATQRWGDLDRLLVAMLRVALAASCVAATVGLVLAVIEPWPGSFAPRLLAGTLILIGNVAAYAGRWWLYAAGKRFGATGVAISLAAGGLLFVDGARDSPYTQSLLAGVELMAIMGRVGWALTAAMTLSGLYLAELAVSGASVASRVTAVNVAGAFMMAGALGSVQWWFARFINNALRDDREPAPVSDARKILMREHLQQQLSAPVRSRRVALLPGAPDYAVCTLSAAERVQRLSALQREIFGLQAQGLRKSQIARRLHVSARTLYRERQRALRLAHARSDEQLIGMIVHVEGQDDGHQDEPLMTVHSG